MQVKTAAYVAHGASLFRLRFAFTFPPRRGCGFHPSSTLLGFRVYYFISSRSCSRCSVRFRVEARRNWRMYRAKWPFSSGKAAKLVNLPRKMAVFVRRNGEIGERIAQNGVFYGKKAPNHRIQTGRDPRDRLGPSGLDGRV